MAIMNGFHRKALSLVVLMKLSELIVGSKDVLNLDNYTIGSNVKNNSDVQMVRVTRNTEWARGMHDNDYHDVAEKPKSKPWLGYYDFLITEGSYKFWVVFELFTIGVLIYSAFAAIYYAKYTINDYDNYDDYFLKRSARSTPPTQTAFLGLPVETYVQIFNAIANYNDKYT